MPYSANDLSAIALTRPCARATITGRCSSMPKVANVFHASIHVLLIATLLGCPLCCQLGALPCECECQAELELACVSVDCSEESACSDSNTPPPRPEKPRRKPTEQSGNCICAGALKETSKSDTLISAECWVSWSDSMLLVELPISQSFSSAVPPSDSAANSGREVRTLHMSFLC